MSDSFDQVKEVVISLVLIAVSFPKCPFFVVHPSVAFLPPHGAGNHIQVHTLT